MITILHCLLLTLLTLVFIPDALLLLQVASALWPRRLGKLPDAESPRIAVIVPAHNESAGVRVALDSVMPQLSPADRLVVVADNCSDDTARVAADAGAEVLERRDEARRGKGYALDYGVRHLSRCPPEVVIIIDADCKVEPGTIRQIALLSAATSRPVQAVYLMKLPPHAATMAPIKEFAWLVKNLVRPLGYQRLHLPCQLMGTGMAFPWSSIRKATLASGHIVEDLKLGLEYALGGAPPLLCPDALVTSIFPANAEGLRTQQARWEHGHLGMVFGEAPRYMFEAVRRANLPLAALTLDMCVPPLALLSLAILALGLASLGYFLYSHDPGPLLIDLALLSGLAVAVMIAWARFGRRIVSARLLLCAPIYALAKIPVYLGFLVRRQVEWVRSKRDLP